jgi:serine/threonine-protein kinase
VDITETAIDLDGYRALLKDAGIDADTLAVDDKGTLAAEARPGPHAALTLPPLASELVLRAAIARGGMGEIRLARQVALARDVAVKRAMADDTTRDHATQALVHEARITGALEHPNIVPIHALGRGADGEALLVMKRIEGDVWSGLLARRPSTSHELERHVGILIDVCHALHFTHARGVVHRDLTPANVMVGSFGEVYVLDWGIAVTTDGDGDDDTLRDEDRIVPGAPRARDVVGIAGTPQFMAPEMAIPGELVDARTDVFLLGAVLHVILTGQPPHRGNSVAALLCAAATCAPPVFDDEVPSELAAICTRALAKDRNARFASADEFRAALVAFLRHDGARALVVEARAQLAALEKLVDTRGAGDAVTHGAAADLEAARTFSAARFGFEAALRAWPESPDAKHGLRAAIVAMARWEVLRRHLDAARVLAADLDAGLDDNGGGGVPVALREAMRALDDELRREASAKAALEAREQARDPRRGTRTRAVILGSIIVGWVSFALFTGIRLRGGDAPHSLALALANVMMATVFGVASVVIHRRGGAVVNVRYMAAAAVNVSAIAAMWVLAWWTKIDVVTGVAMAHIINACAVFSVAWFGEPRRMIVASMIMFVGAPLAVALPAYCFEMNAIVVSLAVVVMVGPRIIPERAP